MGDERPNPATKPEIHKLKMDLWKTIREWWDPPKEKLMEKLEKEQIKAEIREAKQSNRPTPKVKVVTQDDTRLERPRREMPEFLNL